MQLRRAFIGIGLAALGASVLAQAPAVPAPSFEAASIKPNRTTPFGGGIDYAGSRLVAEGVTVEELIRAAYSEPPKWLPSSSIVGTPDWATKDKFDVAASRLVDEPAVIDRY
jgi:uncharacterized protein (TIGR03435 family)